MSTFRHDANREGATLGILRLVLFFIILSAYVAEAQFDFSTNSGTISIDGYTGSGGEVSIPSTINGLPVTSIGSSAFSAANITSIEIPDSVTDIGDDAFYYCLTLTNATIQSSIVNFGQGVFAACTNLSSVITPNGLSQASSLMFFYCSNLKSITLSTNIASIDRLCFQNCFSIANVVIPSGVSVIGYEAFQNCSNLTSIVIPNQVTSIGYSAFQGCSALTNAIIGSAGYWFSSVFRDCGNLRSVTISNGPTFIGTYAFYGCTNLGNVMIPDSVTNIQNGAFEACDQMETAVISSNISVIAGDAFLQCDKLTAFNVDPANPYYSSRDGVLFNRDETSLITWPSGRTGAYVIPSTTTNIYDAAFYQCSGLTSVTIPDSVVSISRYAFAQCSGLTNVTIPDSVTSLGDDAFYGCSNLVSVVIGNRVTDIGIASFDFCGNLTGLYFRGNAPTNTDNIFYNFYNDINAKAYFLPGTTGWAQFASFSSIPVAVWQPKFQIGNYLTGSSNQFGFNIDWTSGQHVVVESCTNLTNPTWIPLATNLLTDDVMSFSDTHAGDYRNRFYRLRSP